MMKKDPLLVREQAAKYISQQKQSLDTISLVKDPPPTPSTRYIPPTFRTPIVTPTTTTETPKLVYPYESTETTPHVDKQMEQAHKKIRSYL